MSIEDQNVKEPLLGPMAALAAGIVATRLVYFEGIEGLMLMTAFLALAAIAEWNGIRRCAHICVILAVLGAGVWTGALHMRGPAPAIEAESGEVLLLQGCVVEPPVFFEDREQFIVELDTDARARVTLNLREGQAPPRLEYGQMVEFDAKVRKPRNFRNPGAFDYEGYLARKNIFWMASAPTGTEIKVLEKPCGSAFWKAVFGLRSWSLTRIEQLYKGDPYHTAMMQAILLGESSKLEKVWIDHFKRTGTYHALVISGIHVTVLAGLLFTLVRRTTMHEPLAFFLGITAAWLYALVAGWSAPVVRAAGGFTMYLAARFFFRRGRILNLLSAVALGFLLFDPEQMFDASFQLSFLSVVAIGVMAVPFLEATTQPIAAGLRRFADPESDLRLPPRIAQMRIEFRLLVETVELWTRLPLQRIAGFTALTMVHICEVAATSRWK